jgi:Protein of unknown function (DUF2628)
MAIYTVYEPPPRGADPRHADRLVFVRDGFFWSAFLFAPLWMLRHRLWLAFMLYVAVAVAVGAGAQFFRLSAGITVAAGFLLSLLIGFEASTLRRWALARRKWTNVGVVVGDDLELAERRFFDAWIRHAPLSRSAQPSPGAGMRSHAESDVIGLFPQPGGRP